MKTYVMPSIEVHDLSKFQFAQNQATCGAGIVQLDPIESFSGICGLVQSPDLFLLCLSEPVDSDVLQGLVLNMAVGSDLTIANCTLSGGDAECPAVYVCDVSNAIIQDCVNSIRCPDGTIIDTCPNQDVCVNGGQIIVTDSIQS